MNKIVFLLMMSVVLTSLSSQAAERTLVSCASKYVDVKVIEKDGMLVIETANWLREIGAVSTSRVQLSFIEKISQKGMDITAVLSPDIRESGTVQLRLVSVHSADQIKTIQITSDNSFVQESIVKALQFENNNAPIFDAEECKISK